MKRRSRIGALGAALLALLGSGAPAQAQTAADDAIPPAWVAYAQRVSLHLQAALEGDSEPAQRFHAYFTRQAASDEQTAAAGEGRLADNPAPTEPPTVRVKVWLDRTGRVTRVDFSGVDDAQAAGDLKALLLRQRVGAVPPRSMRQPVVVRLSLAAQL